MENSAVRSDPRRRTAPPPPAVAVAALLRLGSRHLTTSLFARLAAAAGPLGAAPPLATRRFKGDVVMSGVQLQGVLTAFCLSPLPSLLLANPAVKGQGKSIHGTATLANTSECAGPALSLVLQTDPANHT